MAKSLRKIVSKSNETKKEEKGGMLNIIVDYNIQKFMFIHQETTDDSKENYIIQQYDLNLNDHVKFDKNEIEENVNPVIEFLEESGPINISKKYPNIARTMDGICAFSADDTVSFRFLDNFDFIPSSTIISKRDDQTDIDELRLLLLKLNSHATIFERNLKIFKLIHIPSGDIYTLILNKNYNVNQELDAENMPIIVKKNP
jgi:hypothetical protein